MLRIAETIICFLCWMDAMDMIFVDPNGWFRTVELEAGEDRFRDTYRRRYVLMKAGLRDGCVIRGL